MTFRVAGNLVSMQDPAWEGVKDESVRDLKLQEVVGSERKPEQAASALEGLKTSVEGFEASHPRLVEIVDRLAITLSNMGI